MSFLLLLLLCASPGQAQESGQVRGTVIDAQTGEPLARVRAQLLASGYQATTDDRGRFDLGRVQPGRYTLQVSTVGYRLARQDFWIAGGDVKQFEVLLSPDSFRHTDSIEVRADVFEPLHRQSPSELTLTGSEAKNLASVLADDPLRAVQALPGVTSGDDFNSRFSLRGAGFHRVGLYLDDILLHAPFHSAQEQGASGSLTIVNGDLLEDLSLYSSAFPARYGDRTGGVLDMRVREGSRRAVSIRGTASASNAGLMGEGPLGGAGRGSWMAGIRKSYLQYIVRRTTDDPTLAGGFWDAQARLTYDLLPRHNLSLNLLEGRSGMDRADAQARIGLNEPMLSHYHVTLANLGWRYVPGGRFLVSSRAAWSREKYDNLNRDRLGLVAGHYGEWVWTANATWDWHAHSGLDAGWSVRRIRDSGYSNRYQFNPFAVRRLDDYAGAATLAGGHLQHRWSLASGRLRLAAGGRWDRHSTAPATALSPQASAAIHLRQSTRIQFAWGTYTQFPALESLLSRIGHRGLLPERSIHYVAGLEHRIGERSRVRLEFYSRQDRDLLFRPFFEPRLAGRRIFNPVIDAPIHNSLRGYGRGFETFFQRRTANRFTGWVSYAFGQARLRDGLAQASFPADHDQRHTVNIYTGYRIRPTINLSTRWLYGSGFPVPGFLRYDGRRYFLAEERNRTRLDPYHRADLRINKAFVFDRCKLTLYGEVVNLFNRTNRRYEAFNGYNVQTGQARPGFSRMFPILPSAGLVVEY